MFVKIFGVYFIFHHRTLPAHAEDIHIFVLEFGSGTAMKRQYDTRITPSVFESPVSLHTSVIFRKVCLITSFATGCLPRGASLSRC